MTRSATALDRAHGALAGVAIGDALGMPSQTMSREAIAATYGRIEDFVAPAPDHPVSHGLAAAMITDDTEQSLLLAERLIRDPAAFDHQAWAEALIAWEAGVRARGLGDLLGPSSKRALQSLIAGERVDRTGRTGTTNGAAMRIAPMAIATPYPDSDFFVGRVAEVCQVTHNTREAISAASAVAAIISCGVQGASFDEALPTAMAAAQRGARLGAPEGEVDISARIKAAIDTATRGDELELAREIGTSVASRESVATAFGVVRLAKGDPWKAAVIAANIGDDTDTIGAMAAGMAGACAGVSAFPPEKVMRVAEVNDLDLPRIARELLAVRARQNLEVAQ
ncbi:MAG: ADP-ribosylglycohydrolase family protein [Pseudomonadota bacterium]